LRHFKRKKKAKKKYTDHGGDAGATERNHCHLSLNTTIIILRKMKVRAESVGGKGSTMQRGKRKGQERADWKGGKKGIPPPIWEGESGKAVA